MRIGLLGILGVVFTTLKLTDNIDWSWVWVLSPFWLGGALLILLIGIIAFVQS